MCCQPRGSIIIGSRGKQNKYNVFNVCPDGFLISYPFIAFFCQIGTYVLYAYYYNHVLFNGQVHYTAPGYEKGLYPSIYQG